MECLELYCDLLLARIGLIETQKYGSNKMFSLRVDSNFEITLKFLIKL